MSRPLSDESYQALTVILQGVKKGYRSRIYEVERLIEGKAKRTEKNKTKQNKRPRK